MATNYRFALSCQGPGKYTWYCSAACSKEDGVLEESVAVMDAPPDGEVCAICNKDLYRDPKPTTVPCAHESELTPDGNGAFCRFCGETLA